MKLEGASTITQQLAKNLFLYKDQTYTRKVNEWAVALQIERLYTKDQILEMYMNYVFLGAGAYGFEAGSRTYFGKSLKGSQSRRSRSCWPPFLNPPSIRRPATWKRRRYAAISYSIKWRNISR